MAKKKITKKRLKELVSNALNMPADPPIGSSEYDASFQVTDGLGKTNRATYSSGYWNEPIISSSEARQNRLDLYDGTAELLLKLKNNLDLLTWVNHGDVLEGKGRRLRITLKGRNTTFYNTPFLSKPEVLGTILVSEEIEEKILLRAGTSVPNRTVLKLLNEL